MKKILLLAIAFVATMASAQVLNVASVEKLDIPANSDSKIAGISPDGAYVLITTQSNAGLQQFDLATSTLTTITSAVGAGYNVEISADSKEIIYREVTYTADKSRMTALVRHNVQTADKSTLVSSTRNMHQARVRRAIAPTLSIQNGELVITIGTVAKILSPNGQGRSYLWPSLSPDGSKILYHLAGNGTWVCNLDGSNPQRIGNFRAPQWYNNNIVVGMNDQDNGHYVTSSEIVVYTLAGEQQVLTNGAIMAMYPYASADGKKIVCSTPNGEAYLINIK
jgi:Tol biopolymer transport system component